MTQHGLVGEAVDTGSTSRALRARTSAPTIAPPAPAPVTGPAATIAPATTAAVGPGAGVFGATGRARP